MQTGPLKGLAQLTKKGMPDLILENDLIGESESEIESSRLGVLDNLAKNTNMHLDLDNKKLEEILDSGHFYQTESEREFNDFQDLD
jgi:hypothetical protein